MSFSADNPNELLRRRLVAAGLRPSTARICVLRHVEEERGHPTAERIHTALRAQLPGLSKASVYNSLAALEGAGLLRRLTMDGNELRYDVCVAEHGHFRCRDCGEIRDFTVEFSTISDDALSDCLIESRDFLVWGLCPDCAKRTASA